MIWRTQITATYTSCMTMPWSGFVGSKSKGNRTRAMHTLYSTKSHVIQRHTVDGWCYFVVHCEWLVLFRGTLCMVAILSRCIVVG